MNKATLLFWLAVLIIITHVIITIFHELAHKRAFDRNKLKCVIQWHFGVTEYDFYTVLFGIGRAIGICANIIWDRALMYPLERPKSITTEMLEKMAMGENSDDEPQ